MKDRNRVCVYHRRSQRTFKLSANCDQRLDAKASSTGLRRHWILKDAKYAHEVCDLRIGGSFLRIAIEEVFTGILGRILWEILT